MDALSVGIAQALALIPGTSRSGITITTGLFRGMTREAAARFSFLLAAPILAGASLKKLFEINQLGIPGRRGHESVGWLSHRPDRWPCHDQVLHSFPRKKTLYVFIYYRILLGIVIFIIIQLGGLKA